MTAYSHLIFIIEINLALVYKQNKKVFLKNFLYRGILFSK